MTHAKGANPGAGHHQYRWLNQKRVGKVLLDSRLPQLMCGAAHAGFGATYRWLALASFCSLGIVRSHSLQIFLL